MPAAKSSISYLTPCSSRLVNIITSDDSSAPPCSLQGGRLPPSSAGWKSNRTVLPAGMLLALRWRMAAASIKPAMWPSWPHRCATPSLDERYGSPLLPSVMRSASMSARSASVRMGPPPVPGPVPSMSTTRPVPALGWILASGIPATVVSSLRSSACVFFSSKQLDEFVIFKFGLDDHDLVDEHSARVRVFPAVQLQRGPVEHGVHALVVDLHAS